MHPTAHTDTFARSAAQASPAQTEGPLRRAFQTTLDRWRRRKMIAALEAMDDRILNDIGLHRGDITRVVDSFDARELRMRPVAARMLTSPRDLGWRHVGATAGTM